MRAPGGIRGGTGYADRRLWVNLRGQMLSAKNIRACLSGSGAPPAECDFLETVVDILRSRTGVDFAPYRAAMLERRISNHLASSGVSSLDEYLSLLRTSAAEPFRLLERITIKVSRFYRHAPAFDHLRQVVLPELARARGGEPLLIWCAGCGAGEEAYTLAMLLENARIDGIHRQTITPVRLNFARPFRAAQSPATMPGMIPLPPDAEIVVNRLGEPIGDECFDASWSIRTPRVEVEARWDTATRLYLIWACRLAPRQQAVPRRRRVP